MQWPTCGVALLALQMHQGLHRDINMQAAVDNVARARHMRSARRSRTYQQADSVIFQGSEATGRFQLHHLQKEALELVEEVAGSSELRLDYNLEPGMQQLS
jgi:hypothetical protein